jgi:hypothetical protein
MRDSHTTCTVEAVEHILHHSRARDIAGWGEWKKRGKDERDNSKKKNLTAKPIGHSRISPPSLLHLS